MKNLFKLKKIFMLSAAVMLPIGGIAIAVPLLIQQYPTSSVQKIDDSIQSKVLSSNQFAVVIKSKEKTVRKQTLVEKIFEYLRSDKKDKSKKDIDDIRTKHFQELAEASKVKVEKF